MKAIIPIAGFGTRFLPVTKSIPKAMFPIIDKPVIYYLVEEALSIGIKDIIFIVSDGQDSLKNYFSRNSKLENELSRKRKISLLEEVKNIHKLANFSYVTQDKMKGNGDALLRAEKLLGKDSALVLFGDDLVINKKSCAKQMMAVYEKYKAPVVALARVPKNKVHLYGVVGGEKISARGGSAFGGKNGNGRLYKINQIVEKPGAKEAPSNLTIVGKYIVTPELFRLIKKTKPDKNGEVGIADTLALFLQHNTVYGYEFEGDRYDCGSKLGLLKANIAIGLKHPEIGKELKKFLRRR